MGKGEEARIASRPFKSLLSLLLVLFSSVLRCSCGAQGDLTSDALALLGFKNNLTLRSIRSRAILASWNTSSMPTVCSSWVGVVCSSVSNQQRVSELHLPGRSLYGIIAADSLGQLDALDTLSLRSNKISGSLPADFANLSSLRKLHLQSNNFSGSLPSNFSPWSLLSQLDLSYNSFSGSIPASLNSLTHLISLSLQNNLLNGTIPSLDIPSLQTFNVSNNNLTGSVPVTLGGFPSSSFTGNKKLCGVGSSVCSGDSPQASQSKSSKLSKRAIVGISSGAASVTLLLLILVLLCFFLAYKKQKGECAAENAVAEVNRHSSSKELEQQNKIEFMVGESMSFELEDLLCASAEVLGKGTIGTAYKAVLQNGLIIVVKRLRNINASSRRDYQQCIRAIGSLRHDSLVPLRAYYSSESSNKENFLVFDYIINGSLSALLHNGFKASALDWEVCLRIAATAAKGLAFLHSSNMVHGNIKSSNVLLKSYLDACLTDYGLFEISVFNQDFKNPYLAPEITNPNKITSSADVFSFGVLLLELITGKEPQDLMSSIPDAVHLHPWVQSVCSTVEIIDPRLLQSGQAFNEEEMLQLLQVIILCVTPSPTQRPSMANVVQMIDNIRLITSHADNTASNLYPGHCPASTSEGG